MPLADIIHGVFKMTPPELLHTTQEGLTKYMLGALAKIIKQSSRSDDIKHTIELLFKQIHRDLDKNSDKNYPRGSDRSGVFNDASVNATELRGNLFRILILSHTEEAHGYLYPALPI